MKTKLIARISLILLGTLLVTTSMYASGIFHVQDPEATVTGTREPIIAAPILLPPDDTIYSEWSRPLPVTSDDTRPVAQFAQIPATVGQDIAVDFPQHQPPDESISIWFEILASVRYTGNGHVIHITTSRPSPATANTLMGFGNRTVTLGGGDKAWVNAGLPGKVPNQLVMLKGDLIITIAGDLSTDDLQTLATAVNIQ